MIIGFQPNEYDLNNGCPFCKSNLKESDIDIDPNGKLVFNLVTFSCLHDDCLVNGISKFQASFLFGGKQYNYRMIILTNQSLYVQGFLDPELTIISKLEGCILTDQLFLNTYINFNFNDIQSITKKISAIIAIS